MDKLRFLYKYINHFFTARHTRGFGVHSPFVYQFTQFVIYERYYFYTFTVIEKLRSKLLSDSRRIEIQDYGTGVDRIKKLSEIVKREVSTQRCGQLLFRLIHYFKLRNILELGTSVGLTTAYLAASSSEIHCVSLEGSQQVAEIAKENIALVGLKNVEIKVGNIDKLLPGVINQFDYLDLVFFDANHRSDALIHYFDLCLDKIQSLTVFVVHDIHWSDDMEFAWDKIKNYRQVTSTIDLFYMGIVFFNPYLNNKHYKMRI
jgi:predicted O-methyltransferase YrrM